MMIMRIQTHPLGGFDDHHESSSDEKEQRLLFIKREGMRKENKKGE